MFEGWFITEAVAQVPDVMPLAQKLNYEGIILSVIVLMLSIGLVLASLKFTHSVMIKGDAAIKELANKINDLNGCMIKITEIQAIDHSIMMGNRDILSNTMSRVAQFEMCFKEIQTSLKSMNNDLDVHAKDCAEKKEKEIWR